MLSIEKNKRPSVLKNIDWIIIITVLLLNIIGLLAIHNIADKIDEPSLFKKQLIASIIGIVAMIIIMMFDYKDFRFLSLPIFVGTVLILVYVLIAGVGLEETGTQGWIDLGFISFQPSELGKITLAIVSAYFFERIKKGEGGINYILLFTSAAILIGLVLLQPDFGTAVVYVFMLLCMIFVFGIKYRVILITAGIGLVSLPILWFSVLEKVFDTYQINRILSFLNPEAYALDADWQVRMAIRYIGSGMLTGVEPGTEKAVLYVPTPSTDSIIAIIGEKWGFVATATIVVLFAVLLLRTLYVAKCAKDKFASYMVIGLMSMFLFHFVENIGMNLRMLPLTGIPLPFISYGGTSVIANYIAIGLIVCVSMRREKQMFE